jgi:hypothetical protein
LFKGVGVEVTGSEQRAAQSPAAPSEPDTQVHGWILPWFRAGRLEFSAAWRRHRRPLTLAGSFGAIVLLYVAYLGQSRSLGTDADGASNVLQAWEMLHGNLLLRGWWLSDVSFYTTELPEYMLVELARGLNPGVINAAGAATYTLLIALAAWLAKGRATGTAGLLRVLIAGGRPAPHRRLSGQSAAGDRTGRSRRRRYRLPQRHW